MSLQTLRIGNHKLVVMPEFEYKKLVVDAERGMRNAEEYANESIGWDIRNKRNKAHLSQETVAKKAGIRVETLSRIETGKANPTVKTIKNILKGLGE